MYMNFFTLNICLTSISVSVLFLASVSTKNGNEKKQLVLLYEIHTQHNVVFPKVRA